MEKNGGEMFERILMLSPHTDDVEFGCGGSIVKFLKTKAEVFYVAFSCAEKSVPLALPKDTLIKEAKRSTQVLGIPSENLILFNFEVRKFPHYRQEILEDMIRLNKIYDPDLVFLPSRRDIHQDHQTISMEGLRAFKHSTILGYEIPWNIWSFETSCFVPLTEDCVEKKIKALKCYISQLGRGYVNEELIRSFARSRGGQIGTRYAEAFETVQWVIT